MNIIIAKVEIVQLRRQINEERLARHKAEQKVVELTLDNKKLREENSRLKRTKGSLLDDDSVLESIEASFKQFHEFMDLLRDAGLGKLITMAGLDGEGSPFNSNARDHIQSFQKSFGKSNTYSGDIDGKLNGNIRPKPYLSNSHLRDPVMNDSQDSQNQSGFNDTHDEAQKRRDELYEKILRDTSTAFNRIGEQNVTLNISADTSGEVQLENIHNDSDYKHEKMSRSKIPKSSGAKRGTDSDTEYDRSMASEKIDNLKGPGGEIIMSLSPFDDDGNKENDDDMHEGGGVGQTSRVSDFSYGMDSFEQSYVSERGEVVHLGEEMDYPESPSPIRNDNDDDDDDDF
ncbi:Centrosomal protein of 78 kDa [Mactra antiquata]